MYDLTSTHDNIIINCRSPLRQRKEDFIFLWNGVGQGTIKIREKVRNNLRIKSINIIVFLFEGGESADGCKSLPNIYL